MQKSKIYLKCNKDNYEWTSTYYTFINKDHGCSVCNISRGEIEIKNYLIDNKIEFISQYKFDDCRHKRSLPFDFYIPEYNVCIEYDGSQHYIYREFFSDRKEFDNMQKRDSIKTKYCKNNDINLIRISYKDFKNIANILKENIN